MIGKEVRVYKTRFGYMSKLKIKQIVAFRRKQGFSVTLISLYYEFPLMLVKEIIKELARDEKGEEPT